MDRIYRSKLNKIKPFAFDEATADVFDDMLDRSIPWYGELQRFIALLTERFYVDGTYFYDIGCSTGNSIISVSEVMGKTRVRFVAVDSSPHMIKRAQKKCYGIENIKWICDGVENIEFKNGSIVNMAYILQFIPEGDRKKVLERVFDGMVDGGILIFCEKTHSNSKIFEESFIDIYHDFKMRNGYSKLEIDQKRKALEKILVPMSLEEYEQILKDIGFREIRILMKYLNFTSMVAVK